MIKRFGNTAVPYTVSWSAEEAFRVDICPHAKSRAICQVVAPGEGRPLFGKPHSQRQRQAIAMSLCDLCGRPLRNCTKVSLSHARRRFNAAEGAAILQVEPLLHKACAAESMKFCPSLRRDMANGTLMVRAVHRHQVQFAIIDPEYVSDYVPGYAAVSTDRIVGHAKVELLSWTDQSAEWLGDAP